MPGLISIVGRKNAGKTTLVVALAHELGRRKRRVATIKHAAHPLDVDRPGTDSWRHMHEGGAFATLIASPDLRVTLERRPDDTDPAALAHRYFPDADFVLVEGFKAAPYPKIEVWRKGIPDGPLVNDPATANASEYVALVTDDPRLTARCQVLHFNDTNWLTLLGMMVEAAARPV